MFDDQLNLLNEDEAKRLYWCKRHRYVRQQSFIEVEIKRSKEKVMRCRYCVELKEEQKKIAAVEWENHKKFVTDYYVRKILARESKIKLSESIPDEIIEAKRATLLLKNTIVDIQKPLLVCNKHGKLYVSDVNRSELTKTGKQRYRCKRCQKDQHTRHYEANKALYRLKQQQFRKEKPELVAAQRKRYRKKDSYKRIRTIQEKVWVRNLATHYVKKIIAKKHKGLLYSEVPAELVELQRLVMQLRREIKLKQSGENSNE